MGFTEKIFLCGLGIMTAIICDARSLNVDLVNSPLLTRLEYSAQKYAWTLIVPSVAWVMMRIRGRGKGR